MSQWEAVDAYFESLLVPPLPGEFDATGLPPHEVAPNQGRLLELLARAVGARRILELGTLGGYSTIWLARGLADGGRVVTLESDPDYARVAQANFDRAPAPAAGATSWASPGMGVPGGSSASTWPPKPPPTIRAPAAPPSRRRSTVSSTAPVEESYWSRSEACDSSSSRPSAGMSSSCRAVTAASTRAFSSSTCRARRRSGSGRASAASRSASLRSATPSSDAASAHSRRRAL